MTSARARPALIALVLLVSIGAALAVYFLYPREELRITGQVLSLDGAPVPGATARTDTATAVTDAEGWFELPARRGSQWVVVEHDAFLSRTRAANPDAPVLVRLTPDDGETIALHFGGDVMFGRRYFDPNEDGDLADGLVSPDATAEELAELLEHVRPLLANADLTAVNFESPVLSDPYLNPLLPRDGRWHPTKEYVFASPPSAARALELAGVDVVGLGNNHLYDALDEGVVGTVEALDAADVAHFGAGLDAEAAWEPEFVRVHGQTLAFIGCTTITGEADAHPILYTAAAEKAGAAACEAETLRRWTSRAADLADTVIVMIHGGYEYERIASDNVQSLSGVAREAGATLVINHHPHVVGGFEWDGTTLTAHTLGNLLFDQTVWPTFESYVLAVHLRRGEVIRAYAEPVIIEGYVPKGVTGELASHVARGAAGRVAGPFVMEDGAVEVDIHGRAEVARQTIETTDGRVRELDPGWWLSDAAGDADVRVGRDLLWVGSFEEDQDTDTEQFGALLWGVAPPATSVVREAAYCGEYGARLNRGAAREADAVLAPKHRILVDEGTELTLTGMVRSATSWALGSDAEASVQLSWYPDTRGPSSSRTVVPLEVREGRWEPVRLDARVPPGIVAVGVYVRLAPGAAGQATLDVDDLRLIEWAAPGAPLSPEYGHVLTRESAPAVLSNAYLPGALPWLEETLQAAPEVR